MSNDEGMVPWKEGDPFSASHLQQPQTVLQRVVAMMGWHITKTGGIASSQVPFDPKVGWVVAAGPSGEADYPDERYWIAEVTIAHAATVVASLVLNQRIPDTTPGPDQTIQVIHTVSNLNEWVAHSHNLKVGDPVVFWEIYDAATEAGQTKRCIMFMSGGEEAAEFYGMARVTDPDLVWAAEFLPIVDEPPV